MKFRLLKKRRRNPAYFIRKTREADALVAEKLVFTDPMYFAKMNRGLPIGDEDGVIKLYREEEGLYVIPRNLYADTNWYQPTGMSHESKITLRDYQQKASESLMANRGDKILCLACGKGKTVVAIDAACRGARLPMLVVVHTKALLSQWVERIKEHAGVSEDDIGMLHRDRADWYGKKFVVAMLHTLVQRQDTYPTELYDYFNLVVFDECHRLAAHWFSDVCWQFGCERWGLTATPERDDKLEFVFKYHLGPICHTDTVQDLRPTMYFVHTGIDDKDERVVLRKQRDGRVSLPLLVTSLANHSGRNAIINSFVRRAINKDRTALVLGERVASLQYLMGTLQHESKSLFLGGMKEAEASEALKAQVVYATQQMAKEGLDRPAFDTLIIAHPFTGKGRLKQTGGRILRSREGKQHPVILVLQDDLGVSKAMCSIMRRHAESFRWRVKHVDSNGKRVR